MENLFIIYLTMGVTLAFFLIVVFLIKPDIYNKLLGYPTHYKMYMVEVSIVTIMSCVFWPLFLMMLLFNNKL